MRQSARISSDGTVPSGTITAPQLAAYRRAVAALTGLKMEKIATQLLLSAPPYAVDVAFG